MAGGGKAGVLRQFLGSGSHTRVDGADQEREQAEVWIYDGQSGTPRFRLPGHTAGARDLALAPGGSRLAAFFPDDDAISVWDLKTKQKVATLSNFSLSVVGMFLADDGKLLVNDWKELTVWDLTRTKVEP